MNKIRLFFASSSVAFVCGRTKYFVLGRKMPERALPNIAENFFGEAIIFLRSKILPKSIIKFAQSYN